MSSNSTNHILQQAYEYVSEDNMFLRLTTISTIVHSMIFVVIVLYNLAQIASKFNHWWTSAILQELLGIIETVRNADWITGLVVTIGIILAIWYYILPPIGEAAMVYHLEKSHNDKSGSSFSKWLTKFFVMFEWNSVLTFISISTWLILLSRVWILGLMDMVLIRPILIIYSLVVLTTALLTPYVKFKLVVENEKFAVAIKESIMLAVSNPIITARLALVGLILNLRIILNIIILIGVPAILFYGAYILNLHQSNAFYVIMGIIIAGLFLLIAYINSIIEAFFMTYRYLWYRMIEPESRV